MSNHSSIIIIIAIASVACLTVGCTDTGRYDAVLSQIDTLMEDHPDSALQRLDSLRIQKANWPKSLCMRFDLLEAKAQNKAFVDFTTDSVAKEFTDYYDSHGSANDRLLAHYLLGCVYRDLGEAPHAVDCYLDAISHADTTAADCDFYTMSCVYAQLSDIYYQQLLLTYSIRALKRASHYSFCASKPYYGILNVDKIANAYVLLNKKDSAEIILKEVQHLYKENGYIQAALQSSLKLMHLYVKDSLKLPKVKLLIDEYEAKSGQFTDSNDLKGNKRIYYYYKGQYFEGINNLDSAEYYYRKLRYSNMPFTAYNSMYEGLLSIYTKRHQPDSIAKYAKLYCEVNDSTIAKKDQERIAQMAAIYNYNLYQKEARQKEAKANFFFMWLIAIIFTFFIFILLALYVYRNIKQKKQDILDDYIRIQQEKMALEDMLSKNHSEFVVEIEEKRLAIEALEAKLKESKTYKDINAIDRVLKSDKIVEKFEMLANGRGYAPTYSEWVKLRTLIDSAIPSFVPFIKAQNPLVSDTDIELCLLVRLGFRTDQIATLMHLSPSGVSKLKARLLYKIFHEKNGGAKEFEKRLLKMY